MSLHITDDSLKALFGQYDPKNTGFVSFARLGSMLKQIFEENEQVEVSNENLWLLMKRCDSDGDGLYSFKEFLGLIRFLDGMKTRFDQIDSNHSGAINSKEMYKAFQGEGYKFDRKMARKLVRLFDDDESGTESFSNAKGRLEYAEFINLSLYIRELQYQFARLNPSPFLTGRKDKDHSGDLDSEELQPLLKELGIRPNGTRAEKLVAQADKDKSGTIDFEEFVDLIFRIRWGRAQRQHQLRKVDSPKVEKMRDDIRNKLQRKQNKTGKEFAGEEDFTFAWDK